MTGPHGPAGTDAGTDAGAVPGSWTWVDLRLVPVSGVVWAGSLVAPWLRPAALAATAAGCVLLAVAVGRRGGRAVHVALALLAALAVTTAAGAVRGWDREGSLLRSPPVLGAVHEVELRLDEGVHLLGGGSAPRVVGEATVTALRVDGLWRPVSAGVLLFAPADGWDDLLPGQPVTAEVTVRPPRPGDLAVAVVSARDPPAAVGAATWWQQAAAGVRARLSAASARVLEPRPAGLLPGLVVGDTRAADPVLEEEFRLAGLAHLTAVSGANVAIVVGVVLWPLRRRAVDRRVQAAVAGVALWAFVVLAQPTASVVRAAAMGAVTLWALAAGRPRAAVPALSAATAVLLLVDPGLATDPGFALSVAATAAIVLVAPGWSRALRARGWPQVLADAVAVSAAAGAATAPLVAGLSGTVSLVSLPANLLAAPAVPVATVLGLAAAVAGAAPPVADGLVWLAGWPVRWLVLVAERGAGLPDAAVSWPDGAGGAIAASLVLGGAGLLLWWFPRLRPLALAALLAVVLVGWPLRQVGRGWPPPDPVVVACDVGQGDALVVPTGPGSGILVDAGREVGPVDRCLDRLGIHELPLVVVSHLDADHVGGLAGALTGRRVGAVASGVLAPDDERAPAVDALLARHRLARTVLVPGDRRAVEGVHLEVLAPEPERARSGAGANDLSLVLRVTVRGLRVLLTGDLGAEEEARLLRTGIDLSADVLKVPHHGSGDAEPHFLAATGARIALISVGAENTYGHPSPRLLGWLTRAGMRVHRTDLEGDVAVTGRAGDWQVLGGRR